MWGRFPPGIAKAYNTSVDADRKAMHNKFLEDVESGSDSDKVGDIDGGFEDDVAMLRG